MASTVKDAILRGRKTVKTVVEEGRKKVEDVVEGGLNTVETVVEAGLNTVETAGRRGPQDGRNRCPPGPQDRRECASLTGASPCAPPSSTAAKMCASSRFPFPRPQLGELVVQRGRRAHLRNRSEGLSPRISRAHDRSSRALRPRTGGNRCRSRRGRHRFCSRRPRGGAQLRALRPVLLLLARPGKSLRRPALQQRRLCRVHPHSRSASSPRTRSAFPITCRWSTPRSLSRWPAPCTDSRTRIRATATSSPSSAAARWGS